ncbi:MAG: autotransporter outer membrane beta-barrel domain-containing protein, partial [Leptotrichiaceae bacterium]
LVLNGKLSVGNNEGIGAYVLNGGTITSNLTNFVIGNGSYGIISTGTGTTSITNNSSNVTIGDNSVFIYSSDTGGTITNNANLSSASNGVYGLYGSGTIVNNNTIDFSTGIGNVGIYVTNGLATNNSTISVGSSNTSTNSYGIGMVSDSGSVARNSTAGTINVNGAKSIGMYATGAGSKVINDGVINLNTSQTTGMFIENGAEGINNGLITTTGTGTTQVTGVALKTGGILTNNGTININTDNGSGILNSNGVVANYGTITVSGTDTVVERVPNTATATAGGGSVTITVGGMSTPTPGLVTITSAGVPITPVTVTLPSTPMTPSGPPTVAMYVDTSGLRYTTPMTSSTGTALATNLQIGTEVTEYTNAKAIKIDDPNIIIPYSTTAWKEVTSSSLTWVANRGLDLTSGLLNAFYLVKLPYTDFASDTNVYNFADGLEQRYGVEGLTSREKQLFNRLNSIGNNEQILLYQAYDEMMGHQYSNVQQRLFSTGSSLNKEFDYLSSERATASKQSNKIKIFGMKGEYNTGTAGIIDYTNNTYGVAYLHENETIKLGSNTGWYAGFVQNRFDFKDIGGSEENTTMGKVGIFKTMAFDNNGSLTWKISGEGMFGYSQMDRKFLVVDEIFGAESTYTSYGVALRNEISKDIRLTERTSLKPYGSLAIEYGRFSDIKEKTGEMRLEVEGNDYYSIKPEVGVEYKYKQPLFLRSNLTASLGIAYENDLGKVNDAENRARVGYTDADYFNLRGEKENRTGNGKADLKIGIENSRVGLTLDLGYDTKGENVRGGMGLRIIY